ncbi:MULTISPECIES: DUF551 domain-containing protein [unclassified Pseudomonas]|uniref:DUF551 domain-containing protein n=1 Tax=unclassified Pseudomonas TaxID=196821 RepID=UPI003BA03CD2
MTDKMREEFIEAFVKQFGFGRMAASSNPDAAGMLACAEWAWFSSRETLASHGWQSMETCPQHTEVLFYRSDAGVFSGMITDADHFMSDKERDEWSGTEQEMFDLDAFGFGDWGVCRCDGSERPTHWMPLPAEPKVKP